MARLQLSSLMDLVQSLWIAGAAVAGAALGAFTCHRHLSRVIVRLNDRLVRSEQARAGAIERSAQAREQIAKLNEAISELRKAHTRRPAEESRGERTARAEEALSQAAAEDRTILMPRTASLQAFADTQTLER